MPKQTVISLTKISSSLRNDSQCPEHVTNIWPMFVDWLIIDHQVMAQPGGPEDGQTCSKDLVLFCPYLKWLELRLLLARTLLLGSVAVFPSEPCQEHYWLLIFFLNCFSWQALPFCFAELEFDLTLLFFYLWGMYEYMCFWQNYLFSTLLAEFWVQWPFCIYWSVSLWIVSHLILKSVISSLWQTWHSEKGLCLEWY